jgi:ribosomal protein S21
VPAYSVSITPNNGSHFTNAVQLTRALLRLKKEMSKTGTIREIRRRSHYMPQSEARRAKSMRARHKLRKAERRQAAHDLEFENQKFGYTNARQPMKYLPRHAG